MYREFEIVFYLNRLDYVSHEEIVHAGKINRCQNEN
jgi:hypothetical protein